MPKLHLILYYSSLSSDCQRKAKIKPLTGQPVDNDQALSSLAPATGMMLEAPAQ